MIWRRLRAGAAALLLAGLLAACGNPSEPPPSADLPFLWEVANAEGKVEGWLYGTIHALPDGVEWHKGSVAEVVEAADFLVVEVADLDDPAEIQQAFAAAAQSDGQPPLQSRVDASRREAVEQLARQTAYSPDDYRQIDTWAAALIMAQAVRTGSDSGNGVDRALIRLFEGRPISELEGAQRQFAVFDALPEQDQRAMLTAVIDEWREQGAVKSRVDLWLSGDEQALIAETRRGILVDPEVREALLAARNRNWVKQAAALFAAPRRPLIAVGAAHLVGPEGLVALVEAEGYTARRLR